MKTFALIHGAGDVGWSWHLLAAELRRHGHVVVAPDLPDAAASLDECADTVIDAIGQAKNLTVVGHSFGAFTAPLVAARVQTETLVLLAGMVPSPGEAPDDWWTNTGYKAAVDEQAARDGGLTGNEESLVCFYHDMPRELAEEAIRRARTQSLPTTDPWPLNEWPDVQTKFILCTEDRFFPAEFLRRVVAKRLGIVPDEIVSGHCAPLSHPKQVAEILESYLD
jgi:pimeloyl-ACP methyl ester carboxylesterase